MHRLLTALLAVGLLSTTAFAQSGGIKEEVLGQLAGIEKKIVGLAETMPEDKYDWRPGEGVRSVREVYLHVASANYFFPGMIGTPTPEGVDPRGLEKSVTEKAEVIKTLRQSFEHLRGGVTHVADADLDKSLKVFGRESSYRGVLLIIVQHLGEHLGQSIAYARTNGVAPPWSR